MAGQVLVIGATGKTGLAVTKCLAGQGVPVRAAARPGRPVDEVYAAGAAEVARLDLENGSGLAEAVAGVAAVYHLAPNVRPDEEGIARRVVDAMVAAGSDAGAGAAAGGGGAGAAAAGAAGGGAATGAAGAGAAGAGAAGGGGGAGAAGAGAAGRPRLVFHSVLHPEDPRMPHHLRKAAAEQVIRTYPGAWTVLRPAAYHQNLVPAALAGRLAVPYSLDATFTNVDVDDVAAVAARMLTEAGHEGATYDLAGGETLSVWDMAALATDVLGSRVFAERVPLIDWEAGAGAGMGEQARGDLLAMFRAYDESGLVGDSAPLRELLGRRPTTWTECLRRALRDRGDA